MSAAYAVALLYLADRTLHAFGACTEVADLYRAASVALESCGQTYLAGIASQRAALTASLS